MGKISKLLKMQKKLVVPKGQYNSFGKYKYRSAEDIMVALKVVQEAENTVVVIDTDIETANGWNYINATATLYDADDGEVIAVTHGKAREAESKKGADESQITGSATSYAIKRALSGMFLIDDEKDADTLNDSEDYTQKDNAKTVILSQLEKKLLENNININNFVKTLFKKRKNDLTEKEIEATLSRFTSAIDKYRKLTKQ
ncbi:ERF family protein [Dialister invisus]|jgi:hypothetical protein|uniref:ERF family protein n=1 Tax=Dialister invisus TaxID=218538 RepID=UPI0026713E2C|nr:ERF family protein [Dialister invisus]